MSIGSFARERWRSASASGESRGSIYKRFGMLFLQVVANLHGKFAPRRATDARLLYPRNSSIPTGLRKRGSSRVEFQLTDVRCRSLNR